jgi:hypothetical protein
MTVCGFLKCWLERGDVERYYGRGVADGSVVSGGGWDVVGVVMWAGAVVVP